MRIKKAGVATLFLLSVALTALIFELYAVDATGEVIIVKDFQTVQAAIDNASNGDVVLIKSGIYREQLVINKTISVIGESDAGVIIESEVNKDTITVTASRVTITGLTITNSGPSTTSYGVRLCNVSHTMVSNNTLARNFAGVMIEGGSSNVVQDNVIANNRYGVFTRHYLNLYPSNNNTIYHNYIANSSWNGIELDWGENNTVSANYVVDSIGYGFEIPIYAPSIGNTIFRNSFVRNAKSWDLKTQAYGPHPNSWDKDGEGNYRSDYVGLDLHSGPYQNLTGSDGIIDKPYVTMENSIDYYPLKGVYYPFEIGDYTFGVVSNSTVASFSFAVYASEGNLMLSVSGSASEDGFCRVTFPKLFVTNPYRVSLDGQAIDSPQVTVVNSSDESLGCLYVSYASGEHGIEIKGITHVTEYSLPIMLLLVLSMLGGFLFFILVKRRTSSILSRADSFTCWFLLFCMARLKSFSFPLYYVELEAKTCPTLFSIDGSL